MGDANETREAPFQIDANRSRFLVRASATGLLSAFGHNPTIAIRGFSGEVKFNPETPETASLVIRIQANSLVVTDDVSDKDRREVERQMREDVLEVERFPEIVFQSTSISAEKIFAGQYRAKINGQVTLHGITRDVQFDTQVIGGGGDSLRANGEFTLRQTDFNIKPISAVGGTIKLKDELKFTFDIVAHR